MFNTCVYFSLILNNDRCLRTVRNINAVFADAAGMIDNRETTWSDHFDFLQVSYVLTSPIHVHVGYHDD